MDPALTKLRETEAVLGEMLKKTDTPLLVSAALDSVRRVIRNLEKAERESRARADEIFAMRPPSTLGKMEPLPRHQCLIYAGAPSRLLPALAIKMRQMLNANYRCLYLNSPAMVAGMSSCLAAHGVDVASEKAKNRLLLSSDKAQFSGEAFNIDQMIRGLEDAVLQALGDGYAGLWASGDMMWEFGTDRDLAKLGEYERRLEELFHRQPTLFGICQYHCDVLPPEILRWALLTHRALFVDETRSRKNCHYSKSGTASAHITNPQLDAAIAEIRAQANMRSQVKA